MAWTIIFQQHFDNEFKLWQSDLQDELLAYVQLLSIYGPALARPYVDTLKGSKFSNMKELRFNFENQVWRVAFAFSPSRRAVLLCAGDKKGVNQKKFYAQLIKIADDRFNDFLMDETKDK